MSEKESTLLYTLLERMHEDVKETKGDVKGIIRDVSSATKDIALLQQAEENFVKKEDVAGILWKVLSGFFLVFGALSFILVGWFRYSVLKTIKEDFNTEIESIVASTIEDELLDMEFNLYE